MLVPISYKQEVAGSSPALPTIYQIVFKRSCGCWSFLLGALLFVSRFVFADALHGDLYRLFSGMNVSHRHRNLTLSCDFRDLPGITALCTQTRQVRVPKAVEDEWHDSR